MLSNVKPLGERLPNPSFVCKECQLIADESARDSFGLTMYGCSNVAVYIPSKEEWEKEILPIYGSNSMYLIEQSGNSLCPQINPKYFETEPGEKWITEKLLPKLDPARAVKETIVLIPWEMTAHVPFRFFSLGDSRLSWCYDITLGYVSVTILDRDISNFFTQRNKVWGMTSPKNFY